MRTITIAILTLFLISGCIKQPIAPSEQTTPTEELKEEAKENCTTGWKCLDQNRKGYQFPNCVFTQVNQCKNGCKDGNCLSAPVEEERTYTMSKGIRKIEKAGWKSYDFSEQEILEEGVTDPDFSIKLYEKIAGNDYLEVQSQGQNIWVIEKPIAEAVIEDCTEKIADAKTYNYLRTEQTLCIKTKEDNMALIGGYWGSLPEEDTKLSWKYYS